MTTTKTNEVNGKQPIVNGSVNPSLTLEEMLQFDLEQKRTFVHYLQVSGEFAHCFESIDHSVFTKLDPVYEYSAIMEMKDQEVNDALVLTYKSIRKHQLHLEALTDNLHFDLGRKIAKAQQELKFSGELKLTLAQLCGYITETGGWNDFNPAKIKPVLKQLDKTAPRMNYGINNPNTGAKMHQWKAAGDYLFMTVDYCNDKTAEEWQTWFNKIARFQQAELKADSMRIVIDNLDHGGNSITVVMWWD